MNRGEYDEAYRIAEQVRAKRNGHDSITAITAITEELPAVQSFPTAAMPERCRSLIREASTAIGCPAELIAVPMLTVLGAAIGNSRVLKLKEGWEESSSIFAAVIADPGEKKTPAYKVAIEPAAKKQAALRKSYQDKLDEYKSELRAYKVDEKTSARNDLPAPPPPQQPSLERTIVEDTTVEALAVVLEGTPRGVLAGRDELAGWVRSMDQYKQGGRGADRQFWLSAWSNSYVAVDRKSRGEPLILTRPHVSVFGSIQPGVLPEIGAGREDGLLDRFIFAYPDPMASRWTDDEISPDTRDQYRRLYDNLRGRHMPEDDHGDPDPIRIHFSSDAKAVFIDAVNALREEMEAPGFPVRLKGPWSKLEAYLARISLILALARAADTAAAERVEDKDVLCAVALVGYFKAMARRVHGGLHAPQEDDLLAGDVGAFLERHGGSWDGGPTELHKQLVSAYKPPTPEALTRKLKTIAQKHPALVFAPGERWVKELGNKRRFVTLSLRNGGNGGNEGEQ
jgi:uncharacterized protein DUF3987